MNKREIQKEGESKHFACLWEKVEQAADLTWKDCDPEFICRCSPVRRGAPSKKKAAERVYRRLRGELEQECYGTKGEKTTLDSRKIAAVMCATSVEEKMFAFNEEEAVSLLKEREQAFCAAKAPGRSALNRWIVANPFMNYKTAYLAALLFLYDMTLAELVHDPETLDMGRKLGRLGRLCRYPTQPGIDSFDVNLVLGLGRTDIARDRVNTFFLAAQFYQIEMYTRQVLKSLP